MKNRLIDNSSRITASVVIGVSITFILMLSINLFSAMKPRETVHPALVIDLTQWQLPRQAKAKAQPKLTPRSPPPVQPAPVRKKITTETPVTHETRPKLLNSNPADDNQENSNTGVTGALTGEDALPTPMPFYQLTETPRFLHKAVPVFPESMRVLGRSAVVKVSALIDRNGRVREVTVIESAGEAFDAAAIEAIRSSSFIPAKIDGKSVAVLLKLPVAFTLR